MVDIPDYDGRYAVTKDGRVWSYPRTGPGGHKGKFIKFGKHNLGYQMACLCKDGNQKVRYVHRLVALAYIPNPLALPSINHIDGDKANNTVDNLEWVTPKQNTQHAIQTDLWKPPAVRYGEEAHSAKLTEANVLEMRRLRKAGVKVKELQNIFGVANTTVYSALSGITWKHLTK